jgi:type 1 glutamine amidotransferase
MKRCSLLLAVALCAVVGSAAEKKILVYTRNYTPDGKGYVHDNIAASVAAIRKMGAANGFAVDATDDPSVFTAANLKQYRVLVFSNSNNQAFETEAQREAFKAFIRRGGGFVGIHSASGSERDWDYYQQVVGGKFKRHPKLQPFIVQVVDPKFSAGRGIPASFAWEDECYYVEKLRPGIKPVLVTDPRSIVDPQFATDPGDLLDGMRPLAWYQTFDGGREFYLALGHKKEDYENPILMQLILGGIQWAMGEKSLSRR